MSESNSGTNGNGTNKGRSAGTADAAGATETSGTGGKRRSAVRMTAFAPYAAKRAVALEPARSAAVGLDAGRRAVAAASGRAARVARTAWTVLALRKAVAVAAGVGLTAVGVGSYALGRRAERRAQGPLTRLTGGRF